MNTLSEEQEPWVKDLKQHWPDPGPAPKVQLPVRKPLWFPTLLAAAAVVLLMTVLMPSPLISPAVESSVPEWPRFEISARSSRSFQRPTLTFGATASHDRERLQLLQTRMSQLKTQENWSTLP